MAQQVNGATHEGGAAQRGQNRAAEPLDGDAAPVDDVVRSAVDEQRRIVTEIDRFGRGLIAIWAARFAVVQDPVPCAEARFAANALRIARRTEPAPTPPCDAVPIRRRQTRSRCREAP